MEPGADDVARRRRGAGHAAVRQAVPEHERGVEDRVPHDLRGLLRRHPLVRPKLVVLPRELVQPVGARGIDRLDPREIGAAGLRRRLERVLRAQEHRSGEPLAPDRLRGLHDPLVVSLRQHDHRSQRAHPLPDRSQNVHVPRSPPTAASVRPSSRTAGASPPASGPRGPGQAPPRCRPRSATSFTMVESMYVKCSLGMRNTVSTSRARRRFMSAIWNSYSKSDTSRSPRMIATAPARSAASTRRPEKGHDLDALDPPHGVAHERDALPRGEHGVLLTARSHGHDDLVEEPPCAADQVEVAVGDRVERPRIESRSHCASFPRQAGMRKKLTSVEPYRSLRVRARAPHASPGPSPRACSTTTSAPGARSARDDRSASAVPASPLA